jgi:hypothetical protein
MHTPFSTKWLDNFAPNFDSVFEYVSKEGVQSLAEIYRSVFHQQVCDSLATSKNLARKPCEADFRQNGSTNPPQILTVCFYMYLECMYKVWRKSTALLLRYEKPLLNPEAPEASGACCRR